MSDAESIQRSTIARQVRGLWGDERAAADDNVIASVSQALARIEALTPDATQQLDDVQRDRHVEQHDE